MDRETPTEKLMEAYGLTQGSALQQRERIEQLELLFRSMIAELEASRAAGKQVQADGRRMLENLQLCCQETLPHQMVQAIDQAAREGVRDCLTPLEVGIRSAAGDLGILRDKANVFSWFWFLSVIVTGMVTVLVAGLYVRFAFFGDRIAEAKRYEVWGRKIERQIESYPPKTQEQIYRWTGGPP